MKKILISAALIIGAALSFALGGFLTFSRNCETVCKEVLRIHIPANSDSRDDQAIKIKLRDYILKEFSGELSQCETLSDAEEKAEKLLPEIERKSNEFLEENGFSYGAKAELVTMDFTTREYDTFILPAGEYRALRITLGSGEGQNWWCVIFPQLCIPSASKSQTAESVLESFGKPQPVKIKFALFEWFNSILS